MARIGLCGHCNRIRKSLETLETTAEAYQREHGALHHALDWGLRVQREMAVGAKASN